MAQVPPYSGIRRSISCLFWSTTPAKLCWLLELSWEILSPETWFWGCSLEWHLFVVLDKYLRAPKGSQVYWVSFCFLPWLDSWVVNPGVMSWYVDCCGGRKYYRVGSFHVGWSWAFGDPSFQTLIRTWVPGAYSGGSLKSFDSKDTPQKYILLELSNDYGIRLEGLSLWI